MAAAGGHGCVFHCRFVCADWDRHLGAGWPPGTSGIRAAPLSRSRLLLDAGLLGLERCRRLLLGSGNLGGGPGRLALDARILGMGRWVLRLARRILGSARRLLWRD